MENILIIIQVIILDGILSIDNAAALAALAKTLPKKQQGIALRAGILGAYIGRGLMLFIVGWLLANSWVKLLGAGYLLYLCGTHFLSWPPLFNFNFKGLNNFWKTVIMIEIADLAFSLDNVAAVVALSSHIWIIIIGVCISILIMRFAANIFIKLINFEPLLEHAAFVLIGAIAIELILKFFNFDINSVVQFCISIGIIVGFIFYGQVSRRLGILAKEVTHE
jgi:tellurite resistance protein TerC